MRCKLFLTVLFVALLGTVDAQIQLFESSVRKDVMSFQYGFSVKGVLEFNNSRSVPAGNFRLSLNAGVGSNFMTPHVYPSINSEFQFYTGGLGSRKTRFNKKEVSALTKDLVTALTLTVGRNNQLRHDNEATLEDRNIPLYYFTNHTQPCLQNPFYFIIPFPSEQILFTAGTAIKEECSV
jgi:hypothetical protein